MPTFMCGNLVYAGTRTLVTTIPQGFAFATTSICGNIIECEAGGEDPQQCASCLGFCCVLCAFPVFPGIAHFHGALTGVNVQVCPNPACGEVMARDGGSWLEDNRVQCEECGQDFCFACGEAEGGNQDADGEGGHWALGNPCNPVRSWPTPEGSEEGETFEDLGTETIESEEVELVHELNSVTFNVLSMVEHLETLFGNAETAGVQASDIPLAAYQMRQFYGDLANNVFMMKTVMLTGVGSDPAQLVADVQTFMVRHHNVANFLEALHLPAFLDTTEAALGEIPNELVRNADLAIQFYLDMLPGLIAEIPDCYNIQWTFAVRGTEGR